MYKISKIFREGLCGGKYPIKIEKVLVLQKVYILKFKKFNGSRWETRARVQNRRKDFRQRILLNVKLYKIVYFFIFVYKLWSLKCGKEDKSL